MGMLLAAQSAAVTTGIFSLIGALGGVLITATTGIILSSRNAKRQDAQELRRERRSSYSGFLEKIAAMDTAADYLVEAIQRNSPEEIGRAWDQAGGAFDRMRWATQEVKLLAGPVVTEAAARVSEELSRKYAAIGQGVMKSPPTHESRQQVITAMRRELGIDL